MGSPVAAASPMISMDTLGFCSFVYSARRPFVAARLRALVRMWRLPRAEFLGEDLNAEHDDVGGSVRGDGCCTSPFACVLRSKGVTWLESEHERLVVWSSAGRHLCIEAEESDWEVLPETSKIVSRPSQPAACEAERSVHARKWGERRQEIVFIGPLLHEVEEAIRTALDGCLATSQEMQVYSARWEIMDTLRH